MRFATGVHIADVRLLGEGKGEALSPDANVVERVRRSKRLCRECAEFRVEHGMERCAFGEASTKNL